MSSTAVSLIDWVRFKGTISQIFLVISSQVEINHLDPCHTIFNCGGTVSGAIFDRFFDVFWIFLKNEHDKPIGTSPRVVEKFKTYVLDEPKFS